MAKQEGFFTKNQLEIIKDKIQIELLKRGFTAPINRFEVIEGRNGGRYFNIHSEYFQTTPVLFNLIRIESSNSSIRNKTIQDNGREIEVKDFWVVINARYEHFEGGTNGVKIFEVMGYFYQDENYIKFLIR